MQPRRNRWASPDVDSEGVPTDVGTQGPAEPQGPPADDDADDVSDLAPPMMLMTLVTLAPPMMLMTLVTLAPPMMVRMI